MGQEFSYLLMVRDKGADCEISSFLTTPLGTNEEGAEFEF